MNKHEIELDFSQCDKKINVFIGKMGSGKSAILGQLQPFSTYGTLDERNDVDPIIPGEEGIKEITFLHDSDVYEIRHIYGWNKNSQSRATTRALSS